MGFRQKEKSEMTRQEIKEAALGLFLEKGYKNTTVQDIVQESGYSIGAFYHHYKTKQDVLAEIWNEHATRFIEHAIEELKLLQTPEELADYLVDNSNAFDKDEKTRQLAQAAQEDHIFVGESYAAVRRVSDVYIQQIAFLLGRFCPHLEQKLLLSHASLLDAIQYSHSEVTRQKIGYTYDDAALKHSLLILMHGWMEDDRESA